jgi:hypothetical protein
MILRKRGEVKWRQMLQHVIRDYLPMGFGAWIIWKQVYAVNPNGYLALIGFGCMYPAARSAIATILSAPGQSSESPPQPPEPPLQSSSSGGTGEKRTLQFHHTGADLDNLVRTGRHGYFVRDQVQQSQVLPGHTQRYYGSYPETQRSFR